MKTNRRGVLGFLAPWLIGLTTLTLLPAIVSLLMSFLRMEGGSFDSARWVGVANYREAIGAASNAVSVGSSATDPRFYRALGNSLFFALLSVPLGVCSALFVALLLNSSIRGMTFFRAIIYLPHALGGVATVVVWSWLLNPRFGWINQGIRWLYGVLDPIVQWFGGATTTGWPVPEWLYSSTACKPALILIHIWTMGGAMLIFLASLQRVPRVLHEAARLDGAGRRRRLLHITIPQISPVILFNLLFGFVFAMQTFNEAYLLQNRQQEEGLLFYALYVYQMAFESPHRPGYASALAWILFGVLVLVVGPIVLASRRWVHYAYAD